MSSLYLLLPLMFASHVLAMRWFYASLQRGTFPKSAYVVPVSFFLYFDFGLITELLGFPYELLWFPSLFNVDETTQLQVLGILIVAPWTVLLGAWLVNPRGGVDDVDVPASLVPSRRMVFYVIVGLVMAVLAVLGVDRLRSGAPLWELRAQIGEQFGAWAIALYLPFQILTFYVTLKESRTRLGTYCLGIILLASLMTSLCTGSRSTILLPPLVVLLFRFRPSWPKLVAAACLLPLAAAAMLSSFKGHYAETELSLSELVVNTIHMDFSHTGLLLTAWDMADPCGTNLHAYPGAGYVYCALVPIPRPWIADFKGYSTCQEFTAYFVGGEAKDYDWAFALGVLESVVLNFGTVFCLPALFVHGMVLGLADRAAARIPALRVPTRLGSMFFCGSDLGVFLFMYGTTMITGFTLHTLFARMPGATSVPAGKIPPAPVFARRRPAVPVVRVSPPRGSRPLEVLST